MGASVTNKPLRVVQLSDSHLFADTNGKLLGLNTEDSLNLVLERVRKEQQQADLILATGDLSQDGSLASYQRFDQKMAEFPVPCYWVEGNHDVTQPMLETLKDKNYLSPCVTRMGNWQFIMLDSSVPGEVPGHLGESDLQFLERALEASKDDHVMVVLHHHPIPMGCDWLDTQVVSSAQAFFDIIDRFQHIQAIVWGHVHQEYEGDYNGIKLFSVPSTCVQFKPKSEDFAVDDLNPGYRWFDLYDDGRIESTVSRVEGVTFEVDFSVKGY